MADDLGYGDMGCFGNEYSPTPNLDRLADEGVSLLQHYSASPMCAPARASFLTGRYNHRTGAVDVPSNRGLDRIALREVTVADLFKNSGYATGMVGKWHNGAHDLRYHPNARGFDEFAGFLNGGMDYWRWVLDYNGAPAPADGRYLTDVLTEEAVGFIERHCANPFFLYVAYNAPHSPLQAPAEDVEPFCEQGKLNPAVSTLYGMIRRMDSGVGRILDALDRNRLSQNTVVLFTSDNGPWLGSDRLDDETFSMMRHNGPFSGMKEDVLEGGIRVPAVIRCRDSLPSGCRTNELVHFADWLPTLLSLAGVPVPHHLELDGSDAAPALQGEHSRTDPVRFWQWNRYRPVPHCNAAMRDGQWKLVWPWIPEANLKPQRDNEMYMRGLAEGHCLMDVDGALPERVLSRERPPELFDLEADPAEATDLASRYPARVSAMAREWDAWFEEVMAEWEQARADNTG